MKTPSGIIKQEIAALNPYTFLIKDDNNNHDIITVYAKDEILAFNNIYDIIITSPKYKDFSIVHLINPKELQNKTCLSIKHDDIINNNKFNFIPLKETNTMKNNKTKSNRNTKANKTTRLKSFDVNWGNHTNDLSEIAIDEQWSNLTYPNNGILKNYLTHTYIKVKNDRSLIQTPKYALFNTGLFTKYYEPIYAYTTDNISVKFLTEYELGNLGIQSYPERANYFEHPELLLFDWHYKINVQYKHILEDEDNKKRIPDDILNSGNIVTILDGAINTMKKKVSCNYKLAIPQYFNGQIQLLLPLCLRSDNEPDLALVVTKTENCYQGHTCLTLDMAYNNARFITKPEVDWLSNHAD